MTVRMKYVMDIKGHMIVSLKNINVKSVCVCVCAYTINCVLYIHGEILPITFSMMV